jgi:hypothetical protein
MNERVATGLDKIASAVERAEKFGVLVTLVERATSLQVVKDFLKSKDLPHSAGSWDDMRKKRLVPAFEAGTLTLRDLHGLLRRTEGYGKQHIFLFMLRKPVGQSAESHTERLSKMLSEARVKPILTALGLRSLDDEPLVVDLPEHPTLVDARYQDVAGARALLLKEIEKRVSRKFVSEQTVGNTYTKVYHVDTQRVVNVARLWSTGLLELRIASRDNSTKYADDLRAFFNRVRNVFPPDEFVELSLKNLKSNLWNKREELKEVVRFATYTLQDDEGNTLRANAALPTDDLGGNARIGASFAQFESDQVFCSGSNVYFKPPEEDAREVHVLLSGEDHEFAVTAAVTEEEYDHVLRQILQHH